MKQSYIWEDSIWSDGQEILNPLRNLRFITVPAATPYSEPVEFSPHPQPALLYGPS